MTSASRVGRPDRARRRGIAVVGSAVALAAMFCAQMASLTRSAWRVVLQPGPATPDQALAAIAGSLVLLLACWLISALALSTAAALVPASRPVRGASPPPRTSRWRAWIRAGAHLVAPLVVRNAVAAILGVAIAITPVAASATARPAGSHAQPVIELPPASLRAAPQAGPPAGQPPAGELGGPLSPAWAPGGARSSLPAPATAEPAGRRGTAPTTRAQPDQPDLAPGWIPSQPAASPRPLLAARDLAPVASTARRARVEPDDEIVVRRGDTLWALAARNLGPGASDAEIALEWPHWFTANRAVIGADPDHLTPGDRLRAPAADGEAGR